MCFGAIVILCVLAGVLVCDFAFLIFFLWVFVCALCCAMVCVTSGRPVGVFMCVCS